MHLHCLVPVHPGFRAPMVTSHMASGEPTGFASE